MTIACPGRRVHNHIPLIQRGRGTRPDEAPATLQSALVLTAVRAQRSSPRGSRLGKVPNPSHGEMRREEDEEKGPRLTWLRRLLQAPPTPRAPARRTPAPRPSTSAPPPP